MSKREFINLNKDNFVAWKSIMKLHLGSIGDYAKTSVVVEHVDPAGPLSVVALYKRKEHN